MILETGLVIFVSSYNFKVNYSASDNIITVTLV